MTSHTSRKRIEAATSEALARFDTLPADAYVRAPVVAALFTLSRSSVWRWVKAGRIPTPIKIGPQTTAWRVSDLRQALSGGEKAK